MIVMIIIINYDNYGYGYGYDYDLGSQEDFKARTNLNCLTNSTELGSTGVLV